MIDFPRPSRRLRVESLDLGDTEPILCARCVCRTANWNFTRFCGKGRAAGEMRYRERFPQRKATRVDLADIHRVKGTIRVRVRSLCVPRPSVPCSRERPSARARFPLCNAGDFESIAPAPYIS